MTIISHEERERQLTFHKKALEGMVRAKIHHEETATTFIALISDIINLAITHGEISGSERQIENLKALSKPRSQN